MRELGVLDNQQQQVVAAMQARLQQMVARRQAKSRGGQQVPEMKHGPWVIALFAGQPGRDEEGKLKPPPVCEPREGLTRSEVEIAAVDHIRFGDNLVYPYIIIFALPIPVEPSVPVGATEKKAPLQG
jgi:hypothetical protein